MNKLKVTFSCRITGPAIVIIGAITAAATAAHTPTVCVTRTLRAPEYNENKINLLNQQSSTAFNNTDKGQQ